MDLLVSSSPSRNLTTSDTKPTTFQPIPHHAFPAFYTLQPNLTTRHAQLTLWSSFLLSYCAHNRSFLISPTDPIFHNQTLRKRLFPADVRVLFGFMVEQGRAEWVDSPVGGTKKKKQQASDEALPESAVYVWWKLQEEWAALLLGWVEETGQKGAVLTFYELREGGGSGGSQTWGGEGMPEDCLRRVLQTLVRRGKATVFGGAEEEGVKFF